MPFIRLPINSLSGGVGRQAPTKRLLSEAQNIDNCLVTLEKSVEKRPPLTKVSCESGSPYLGQTENSPLSVKNSTPLTNFLDPLDPNQDGPLTNFNTDNLFFHFLDIDGFNRYCIIINRAAYKFDPVAVNSFHYEPAGFGVAIDIKLDDFISVYRIEPTEWIKETVDNSAGINNTSGFNRSVFEYLTFGNKTGLASYKMANQEIQISSSTPMKDTFGAIDYDVGIILWNKLVPLDFMPNNASLESSGVGFKSPSFYSNIPNNEYIHSGDVINYKISARPPAYNGANVAEPAIQEDILGSFDINGDFIENPFYWDNVRDDIIFEVDASNELYEEVEKGQSRENFGNIPQIVSLGSDNNISQAVKDPNGWQAVRMFHHYLDNPRNIPIPLVDGIEVIDWTKDHYHRTSPLPQEDRDGETSYWGFGKVFNARSPYLTFPAGFYRATRYKKNPYFERVRSEGPNTVFDHRRFPLIIYKDTATDGQWRVKHLPLFPRRSGTSLNNPGPSCVNKKEKIQSMAIWKNRLWFATNNNLLASKTNSFFNFWIDDVNNITETDPIDIQASVGSYNKLSHIVPYQNIMLALSSGSTQFEVRGGSLDTNISAFNVEFRPTSYFSTSKLVAPQKMATSIFFMDNGKSYLYVSGGSMGDEYSTSQDVSFHCRGYLPDAISAITASSATNSIFAVDSANKNEIYVHTFRVNNNAIAQNAFHRWILSENDKVVAMNTYEKDMYIISRRQTSSLSPSEGLAVYYVSLESVPVTTPMIDWLQKIESPSIFYDSISEESTITLPVYDPLIDYVVLHEDWGNDAYNAYEVTENFADPITGQTKIKVTGDISENAVWIGRSYLMNVELSPLIARSSDDSSSVSEGVLNIKRLTTRHFNTGNYDVIIARKNRAQSVTTFNPLDLNNPLTPIGNLKISEVGEHFTKVLAFSENLSIFIQSPYPTPCNITNIEVLGTFRPRNTSIE
jgi:hypothetical protein